MADAGQIKVIDKLQGSSLAAIHAAASALQRRHTDPARYQITVVRENTSEVVLFHDENAPEGAGRDIGVRAGNAVELSAAAAATLTSNTGAAKVADIISGTSLRPLLTAAEVFQKRVPDLSGYNVTLLRDGDSLVVTFTDKEAAAGGRGNPGQRPGFEVAMDPRDMRVLRSNFIR